MICHRTPCDDIPLPLLVTGVAGVAGYNALAYFRRRFPGQVVGLRRRDNWRLSGPDIVGCDLWQLDQVRRLFDRWQFRAVLNCEGNCKLKPCELDPAMARRLNVQTVENLLHVTERTPVRIVHLSVDLVFSGRGEGGHREEDPTDPVTVYGATMAAAERLLLADRPDAGILRISLPMGPSFNGHAGAIDWIQHRFAAGKPATLFYDEVRTPTYCDCLNDLCAAMLSSRLSGLYHAGGPLRLSLYEIAQVVNRVGGYDPRLLRGCPRSAAGPMPPRAGNVTMDSSKLRQALPDVPLAPWPRHSAFRPTHPHWHEERPPGEAGSRALLERVLYRRPEAE